MPTIKERHKMDIQDLHAVVHQGQDRGIPVKTTLAKYKVTDRSYYSRCKQSNLPCWRSKNGATILTGKRVRQSERGLTGGSLQGGNMSKPKKSFVSFDDEIAKNENRIKAGQKKSRELDIKLNGRF